MLHRSILHGCVLHRSILDLPIAGGALAAAYHRYVPLALVKQLKRTSARERCANAHACLECTCVRACVCVRVYACVCMRACSRARVCARRACVLACVQICVRGLANSPNVSRSGCHRADIMRSPVLPVPQPRCRCGSHCAACAESASPAGQQLPGVLRVDAPSYVGRWALHASDLTLRCLRLSTFPYRRNVARQFVYLGLLLVCLLKLRQEPFIVPS